VAQWGAHEILAYHGTGAMLRSVLRAVVHRPVLRVHFGSPVDLSDLSAGTTGAALRATERIMDAVTEALEPLRDAERRLPRLVDPTRPVSTARTSQLRHRDPVPPGPLSAVAGLAADAQVREHGLAGRAHAEYLAGFGDAPVGGA
jgi:1-acyl-sn-glycerol-3-phosphate acyltransferase